MPLKDRLSSRCGDSAHHIPQPLRDRCREALRGGDLVAGHTVSALQREVGRALERLRHTYISEFTTA